MNDNHSTQEPLFRQRSGGKIMELLVLLAVLVVWIVLQVWVLPRFGVNT
jgi:hypothetical protein